MPLDVITWVPFPRTARVASGPPGMTSECGMTERYAAAVGSLYFP
jgi:hypothetical protein